MSRLSPPTRLVVSMAVAGAIALSLQVWAQEGEVSQEETFSFRSSVDLVYVTTTVTDDDGRFVPDLSRDDFRVYDNGRQQEITHFSNERVPVSLGIALDTSGSMTAEKMSAARSAIDRFITDLLSEEDELFFMEFSDRVRVRQGWTTDRRLIRDAVRDVRAGGGTALYDAVAEALPVAAAGEHRKRALLVISDGHDSISFTTIDALRRAIRASEVLVYALGVDSTARAAPARRQPPFTPPPPTTPGMPPGRSPFPLPGPRPFPGTRPPVRPQIFAIGGTDRVNARALREITDDTGGRTEIVRGFGDLGAATARIADELSRQYSIGYASPSERRGEWRTIKVEVKGRGLNVRARRGYTS